MSEAELLAAHAAGMTLPQWRDYQAAHARGPALVLAPRPRAGYTLTIPYAALCPDNRKYAPLGGRLILSRRYRAAKRATKAAARGQYSGPCFDVPVQLEAMVWFPDARGDAPNLAKCCHDALQGVCYLNDGLLHDARWRRAGVDKASPRVELTLTPLP